MTELLHQFIEALRNELRQYGEMLALLEQPTSEAAREGPGQFRSGSAIDAHHEVIVAARAERHARQRRLAQHLALPETVTLAQLVTTLPHPYRPLVQALAQENHELSQRVEQRAHQQQHLLQRSARQMQQLAAHLEPTLTSLSVSPEAAAPAATSPVALAQDAPN